MASFPSSPMDRLTASSTPDWPLPAHPHPSLVNVPKESKRHCRLLPAGMVNLSLAQMADAVKQEEQRVKRLDHRRVEVAEQEVEKCASERRRVRKQERAVRKMKKVVVERDSFNKMIESVDELLSLPMSAAEVFEPPKESSIAVIEQPPSPTASMIDVAELDACETAITKPSSSTTRPSPMETCQIPAEAEVSMTNATAVALPSTRAVNPTDPISFNTPLRSNPPSSSDLAHARSLTNAHLKQTVTRNANCERQMMGTQNALAAFDIVTQYGTVARRTKLKRYVSVAKKTKLSVSEAVHRGFRAMFR